jgi:hypothetical protein
MFRSGLVPRPMGILALVGGPLALAAGTGALFGLFDQQSLPSFALTLPEILWEGSFGIYLIVKGFKAAPILDGYPDVSR